MKKKVPWLRYDMKQAEYREAKDRENNAEKALEEAAKLLNDLKEPIKYDALSCILIIIIITINCLILILLKFELLDEKVAYILA